MASFQEGGGGGGGGGGGPVGGGGGGDDRGGWIGGGRDHTWDWPFGSDGSTDQPWDKPKQIERLLGIPRDAYRAADGAQRKAWRHEAKLAWFTERGNESRVQRLLGTLGTLQRSAEFWRQPARERNPVLRDARAGDRSAQRSAREQLRGAVFSQQPRTPQPTARTPGAVNSAALEELRRILEGLRAWWLERQQMQAAEREARRQRRATTMPLGDLLAGFGNILTQATPIVSAVYQQRAARDLARAGGAVGAGGVPLASSASFLPGAGLGASALLGSLLTGQPGALEEGGMLEGLESDIEREASMWRRASLGGRVTPVRTIMARHPQSGSIVAWEYAGKPVLYSRDLAVCKRVNKIARRSAGRVGLRFRRRGR